MTDEGKTLLVPFDSNDPEFTRGFEAGTLWQRMQTEGEVKATIHATNAEMVMRMAERYSFTFTSYYLDAEGFWMGVVMRGLPIGDRA